MLINSLISIMNVFFKYEVEVTSETILLEQQILANILASPHGEDEQSV